jgi:hypothetical protein
MACDPAIYPIKIRRGIHYGPLTVLAQDSNSNAVDLTGFSVFAVGRSELESENLVDLQPAITNAAGGVIVIELEDEYTVTFPLMDGGVWDLVLQNPAGERIPPLLAGPFTVIDYVSRE